MLYRPTQIVVNLQSIFKNTQAVKAAIGNCKLMAVVKANAYGHGLVQVAKATLSAGASFVGVAIAEEGVTLRKNGITAPILVLGVVNKEGALACLKHDLTITVCQEEFLYTLHALCEKHHAKANIHLKLDTGMGRIGVSDLDALKRMLLIIQDMERITLTGAFTHFANADTLADDYTAVQNKEFKEMVRFLPKGLLLHCANSAATLRYPDTHYDMVRAGLALYGYSPVKTPVRLTPALMFKTQVAFVKQVKKGALLSYGCTYQMPRDGMIATLPVGYGDGYHRNLSEKAYVLIQGVRCKVVGRICMDQMMVDVTHLPLVSPGEEVVLLGKQQTQEIDANELAEWADTIPYEILLAATARVPIDYINQVPEERE